MRKFQTQKIRKVIVGVLLLTVLGVQTVPAQTVQTQELPAGYQWVSDGGPSGAKIVDANGNEIDYNTLLQEMPVEMSGASGPAKGLQENTSPLEQGQAETGAETETGTENQTQTETDTAVEGDQSTGQEAVGSETGAEATESTEEENKDANERVIDANKPMVALTFDDGPYAPVGNRIMNVMKQYNSRCTFFVVGERIHLYPEELRQMAVDGFEIANHTQNHKYLNKLGAAEIRSQVDQCNATIASVAGVTPTLMRLPGGNKNNTVLANVSMPIILWNIDTKDWSHRNAQKTIDIVKNQVKDGDIILMHELYGATADAVEVLVPWLTEQGYQLVTVSELIQHKGAQVNLHTLYHSFP